VAKIDVQSEPVGTRSVEDLKPHLRACFARQV
jgi:hypothetical protein